MNALVRIQGAKIDKPVWRIGSASSVERALLWQVLGEPGYTETDGLRTYGGEEDWWSFATESGHIIAVCLQVPYEEAELLVSELSDPLIDLGTKLIGLPVELFPEPVLLQ